MGLRKEVSRELYVSDYLASSFDQRSPFYYEELDATDLGEANSSGRMGALAVPLALGPPASVL